VLPRASTGNWPGDLETLQLPRAGLHHPVEVGIDDAGGAGDLVAERDIVVHSLKQRDQALLDLGIGEERPELRKIAVDRLVDGAERRLERTRSLGHGLLQTVFDVGAAKGEWSRMMSRYFPDATYHLFDPRPLLDPELMAQLEENVSNYKAHFVPKAVAAEAGTVEFSFHTQGGPGSSLLFRDRDRDNPKHSFVEIEAITLDGYAEAAGIEGVDFLKMCAGRGTWGAERGAASAGRRSLRLP